MAPQPEPRSTLRVGFLIDRWQPGRGGAEAALAQLAGFLAGRGHEVHAFGARGPLPGEAAPGTFHRVAARGLTRGARELALGARMLQAAEGCDVTVGVRHLARVDLLWAHGGSHVVTLEARRRARGEPAREPAGRHRTFVRLERALLAEGGARLVACPSRLVLDELARLYPACAGRLVLAPNGVDRERFHPRNRATLGAALRGDVLLRAGADAGTPLFAFASRDPELKGLPALFAALARLRHLSWHLLAAGPKHTARWRRLANRSGLAGRVSVRAHADGAALAAAADLCLLPTWRDTCGLVVLEALASGTPVVTTRYAGAAEVVTPAVGDVVDDPGDAAALAASIAGRLARLERGDVDRGALRDAVSGRGLAAWLGSVEDLLYEVRKAKIEA